MAKKEIKTNKKENNKNKKSFFKDFKAELKKVVWPTPKQLVNNTVAVITIVLITAAIVLVLDLVFDFVNTQGVEKVKEVITSSESNESSDASEESSNSDEELQQLEESSDDQSVESNEAVTEVDETNTEVENN